MSGNIGPDIEQALESLKEKSLELGAARAAVIDAARIPTDRTLRKSCEQNFCGKFGVNLMCPPHVGDIDELIAKVRQKSRALVFQTVAPLEDSYDIEGMQRAAQVHDALVIAIGKQARAIDKNAMTLGAGGCTICERCAIVDDLPCRDPENAFPSLEAHGIFVAPLAHACGMNYINGANTVTYFGAVLF